MGDGTSLAPPDRTVVCLHGDVGGDVAGARLVRLGLSATEDHASDNRLLLGLAFPQFGAGDHVTLPLVGRPDFGTFSGDLGWLACLDGPPISRIG